MSTLVFNNHNYRLAFKETVLQCLLRHGIDYPNSCQSGICHSCLIKSTDGVINSSWQEGLPETLKAQGYFLACLAQPVTTIKVAVPNSAECEMDAQIIEFKFLNYNVAQVKLNVNAFESWTPGKYLSLVNPEGTIRSYSIANIPEDDRFIELHIKIIPDGTMGQWLLHKASKNTKVKLRGPFGHCFYYNPKKLAFNMLLAGTGTGLAPLISIIKSALKHSHKGTITLIHGGQTDEDIYYQEELHALTKAYPFFVYAPCVVKSLGNFPEAYVEKKVLTYLKEPKNTRAYICGPKATTEKLKKHIFLAGVPSGNILSDAFLSTKQ
jgi:NAD(P)H-flavin reductase/ferredoxin